ncbi:MAG: family 16 glycosylhydrolase [Hyphomonas sp.]
MAKRNTGMVKPFEAVKVGAFALVAALTIGLLANAVGPQRDAEEAVEAEPEPPPPVTPPTREVAPSFVHHFGGPHDDTDWYISDFSYPSDAHPAWLAERVHFLEDRIKLEVRRERLGDKNISGGEYQRRGFYHFGRYEVVMIPAPGSGTVSAMFTHTDAYFDDPHDEIDIEFLGGNPRQLHLNYFANYDGIGSIYVPLDFDTTKAAHLYAFEWEPNEIRWYVDDKMIHRSTWADHPIPRTPGRLMVHAWSGGPAQYDWHGRPNFKNGTTADVFCLSYQATGDTTEQCSDTFEPPVSKPKKK